MEWGGGVVQLYSVLPTNRLMGMCSWMGLHFHNWGLFLKRPGNFLGQKANFEIKVCWTVFQFLAYKPVNFALLVDSFICIIFKIFETLILNANMANIHVKQLFGPETLSRLSRNRPLGMHFQCSYLNGLAHWFFEILGVTKFWYTVPVTTCREDLWLKSERK